MYLEGIKESLNSNSAGIKKDYGCYVYILQGVGGKYYTGITNDITRRYNEHSNGQSKSTRDMLPVRIVLCNFYSTRVRARREEVKIKNRGAKRYLADRRFRVK